MDFALVVVRAFGSHQPGDTIDQEGAMREVLGGEHATYVVRVARRASAVAVPAQEG